MKQYKCAYAARCGGCDYQGTEYSEQLRLKDEYMNQLLGEYGHPEPIIGMENPCHYRCKVTATYVYNRKREIIAGVYEKGTHRVVSVDDCLLTDSRANRIILTIRNLMPSFKLCPYDEDSGRGFLRHVQIRIGQKTGQIMVILVCSSREFPGKNNFIKALRREHPDITTIIQNINKKHTTMVLGDVNTVLYGRGYIEDELCGLRFRISPGAFYQVNPIQTEILYRTAIGYADLTGQEILLDAYCGTGTIGLVAAAHARQVIGVELSEAATKDAISNARANNITNASFYNGDATEFITALASGRLTDVPKPDCIIMDPPRSGSTPRFIDAVLRLKPAKVVYVSCGPESLKRDLKRFVNNGYQVKRIQPVDCFPYTGHVETVVLLSGEKVDGHIDIDLDVEKLEGKSGSATYAEIKAYVKEKYGFNVTSLYIGQIKDKAGVKDRKNYNTGSGKGRVPTCPADKEEAIMDAFKYFNLL